MSGSHQSRAMHEPAAAKSPSRAPGDLVPRAPREPRRDWNGKKREQADHHERRPEIRPRDRRMSLQAVGNLQRNAAHRHTEPKRHLLDKAAETGRAADVAAFYLGIRERVQARELERGEEPAQQHDRPDEPGWRARYERPARGDGDTR